MNHIILAFEVVFPLMCMMLVGYTLQVLKITDSHSLNVMNKVVFRVFLPILLFLNIYTIKPEETLIPNNLKLILMTILCILLTIFITQIIFWITVKDKKKRSVMIQGIFRSNLILFGIPITTSIYGANHLGTVSLLAAVIVPIYNILSVIILETYRSGKIHLKRLSFEIIKNPLISASIIAFLLLLLHIRLPIVVQSTLDSMSKVATPLAFVVLGGTFQFHRLFANIKYITVVTIGKLILYPAFILSLALLLGFRNEAVVALLGAAASPTAVSSFTMAVEMEADGELAGQIVVITSISSIVTIFFWVLLLRSLHFI